MAAYLGRLFTFTAILYTMRFLGFLLVALTTLISCTSSSSESENTKSRVQGFANNVESELKDGHLVVLDKHFDKATFVNRVTNDSYWDEQLEILGSNTYKSNYRDQLLREISLAKMFLSGIDGKNYFAYDLAKIYNIENRWHAVFRMYANEAINYHDFLLRIDSNKIWIEDVYIIAVGRQLSKIMQEIYIAGIPSANGDQRWEDHQLLVRVKNHLSKQNFSLALATFDSLSAEMKSQKSIRLFKLQISANVPGEDYIRQIEAYERSYPDDAGTLLLQLDKNFMIGNYPKVITDLNRLEKMYGEDPVIHYLKGNAYYGLDSCSEATRQYAQATQTKKDWQAPWQNRIECLVKNSQYDEAVGLLDTMVARFDYTPIYSKYLLSNYPNFLNSSAYKNWATQFE